MKTRAITEGALMAAITVVIALLSHYVPLFTAVSYFLAPLPTTICCKRWGVKVGAAESVTASLILLFFIDPVNVLILAVDIILPGLMIGYTYEKGMSGGTRVAVGYFAFLLALAFEMAMVQALTGISLMDDFMNQLNDSTQLIVDAYREAGLLESEEGQALMNNLSTVTDSFKMVFPAVILVLPALISYVTVLVDDVFLRRFRLSYAPVPPITQWRLSQPAKTLLGISMIIGVLGTVLLRNNPVLMVYPYTIQTIVMLVLEIMGYAFIFWFIQFKTKKRMVWLRVVIVLLTMFVSVLASFVSILGVLDVYFDLRRFIDKRELK